MGALKILIVEDVPEMGQLLAECIKSAVKKVPSLKLTLIGVASNTWEARRTISRNRPDVVLLDEVLPGESAQDLLIELLKDGLAVMSMTGVESPTHAVWNGVLGRLKKPLLEDLGSHSSIRSFESDFLKLLKTQKGGG